MADKEDLISIELFEKRKDGFYRVNGKSITCAEAIKRIQERIKEQCWLGDCDSEDVAIEALRGLLGDEK